MERRNFMKLILAAAAAPAFVRVGSLMRVNPAIIAAPAPALALGQAYTIGDSLFGGITTLRLFTSAEKQLAAIGLEEAAPASKGVISFKPATTDISQTGLANFYRLYDKDGRVILTGSIGSYGSGNDMVMDNTAFNSGQTLNLTKFDIHT